MLMTSLGIHYSTRDSGWISQDTCRWYLRPIRDVASLEMLILENFVLLRLGALDSGLVSKSLEPYSLQ